MSSPIVQYVVLRSDLVSVLKWPTGAIIAQACHACSAAIHLFYQDDTTQTYLSDLDCMHKVILEAKTDDDLRKLSAILSEDGIHHKLWIEQPEDTATCVATKPYKKEDVQKYFKKFKLFK